MPIRLLADMNVSPVTVRALRARAWDIVRVSDLVPATTPDAVILVLAREQGRVVVTQDLDFSALLALGGHFQPSLITIRLQLPTPEAVTERIAQVLGNYESALAEGCAITITERTVRIRRLPLR